MCFSKARLQGFLTKPSCPELYDTVFFTAFSKRHLFLCALFWSMMCENADHCHSLQQLVRVSIGIINRRIWIISASVHKVIKHKTE